MHLVNSWGMVTPIRNRNDKNSKLVFKSKQDRFSLQVTQFVSFQRVKNLNIPIKDRNPSLGVNMENFLACIIYLKERNFNVLISLALHKDEILRSKPIKDFTGIDFRSPC